MELFQQTTTGTFTTSHGKVFIRRGWVLGLIENGFLRPWSTLSKTVQGEIVLDLALAEVE